MAWKGLKVIGIINVIILISEIICCTLLFLGILLHIDAITKHNTSETDLTLVIISWILSMIIDLLLLYFNFGLINQNTAHFLRNWLIAHGVALIFCLGNNLWRLDRSTYITSNFMATVLLIEIIVVVIFCFIIPSTSGSNTGSRSADV